MAVKTTARRAAAKARRTARAASAESRTLADRIQDLLPPPIRGLVERAREDDILMLAAGLAFYATVSLVPLVLLVLSIVSMILGDQRVKELADVIGRTAPKNLGADQFVRHFATAAARTSIVALLTGLWPATSYGAGLVRAFDDLSPTKDRKAQGLRGRGLVLIVLIPVFVLGALVGSYVASRALGSSGIGIVAGMVLALVAGFLGAAAGLLLIYWIFPPVRLGWRGILTATAVTAGATAVLSLIFTLYLTLGANFEEHYATSGLGVFILAAVWLFLANVMLLVGYRIALERRGG
jgi:membrane protein